MRPSILFPLFADINTLKGVGPKIRAHYQRLLDGTKIIDLIYHIPFSVVDRTYMPPLYQTQNNVVITAKLKVDLHIPPKQKSKNTPYRVICSNETGSLTLVFFNNFIDYLKDTLKVGNQIAVSGRAETFGGMLQMPHPDYILPQNRFSEILKIEPIYNLTKGLSQKIVARTIKDAVKQIPALPEWIDAEMLKEYDWLDYKQSMIALHNPKDVSVIGINSKIMQRLAYDEILAHQLALKLNRSTIESAKGNAVKGDASLTGLLEKILPFSLTAGQIKVIKEIKHDQALTGKMARLLQGDVGSGKTIVALFAALNAIEAGFAVALMVPTEILAQQHFNSISALLNKEPNLAAKVNISVLYSAMRAKEKQNLLADLAAGKVNLVVGTHALIENNVDFKNLGLVIIDEQHRFGVKQRNLLASKGNNTDILLMSATPIPRSLTMALYGDMDLSVLDEKPVGRMPIKTSVVPKNKIDAVVAGMGRVLSNNEQIYWICPLVTESDTLDLAAATSRFTEFKARFGDQVGLVHGRMKQQEKEQMMLDFKAGNIKILIATTVIEVGVDVANATTIIIEHAERFGLAQLHQLRGRVGRGSKQSSCVLIYHALNDNAKQRLNVIRDSEDGFALAEADLKIRGGGDIIGEKQSGIPNFKIANLYEHKDLFIKARQDAAEFLKLDPYFTSGRGENLRLLMHMFEYEFKYGY